MELSISQKIYIERARIDVEVLWKTLGRRNRENANIIRHRKDATMQVSHPNTMVVRNEIPLTLAHPKVAVIWKGLASFGPQAHLPLEPGWTGEFCELCV